MADAGIISKPIQKKTKVHYRFLDGIRGLAALEVLFYHLFLGILGWTKAQEKLHHANFGTPIRNLTLFNYFFVGYGQTAVAVFIVLSGYCLMLPLTKTPNFEMKGGNMQFVLRRSKRILPAYYAALVLGVLQVVVMTTKPLSTGSLVSHMFLVHNFTGWLYDIVPAMWSIAVEWQIYFIFLLILLPVCRKAGYKAGAFFAVLSGILLFYLPLLFPSINIYLPGLSKSSPWMVGCFGIGMAAACVKVKQDTDVNWKLLAAASLLVYFFLHFYGKIKALAFLSVLTPRWLEDYVIAVSTSCVIIHFARTSTLGLKRSTILKFIESSFSMKLGMFSYSLYLTHQIIIAAFGNILSHHFLLSPSLVIVASLVICVPIQIVVAYLFYCMFEKPFMKKQVN